MINVFLISILVFLTFSPCAYGQAAKKEWAFVEKDGLKVRKLKQGQNIQVFWLGMSRKITSKGKLMNIGIALIKLDHARSPNKTRQFAINLSYAKPCLHKLVWGFGTVQSGFTF